MKAKPALALLVAALSGPAPAQTIADQQQRLIDIHALLLDLPPLRAPGSFRPWEAGAGLELIAIPGIDGSTGSKRQITASDRTPLFPRPRLAVGLPAPGGWRAFVGAAYIPPIQIHGVSSHYGAVEAGLAWTPGPVALGLRGHVVYAESKSPVTDPATRDTLRTFEYGADLSAARAFAVRSWGTATPFAGLGVTRLDGKFTVTSDGVELRSQYTALALHAGVRLLLAERWEGVAELDAFPGRLVHPSFKLGYRFAVAGGG